MSRTYTAFQVIRRLWKARRIVAKVGKLMKLCDELETQLKRAEADSARLFDAIIAKLTCV